MQVVLDALHQIPRPIIGCLVMITFLALIFADAVVRPQADTVGIDNPPVPILAKRYVFGIIVCIVLLMIALLVYEVIIGLGGILVAQTALAGSPFN